MFLDNTNAAYNKLTKNIQPHPQLLVNTQLPERLFVKIIKMHANRRTFNQLVANEITFSV